MQMIQSPRLRWVNLAPAEAELSEIDVIQELQQVPKTLPCRYFYDDRSNFTSWGRGMDSKSVEVE